MTRVLVSIGSNQNHPFHQLGEAFNQLRAFFGPIQESHVYQTQPVGPIQQATFANAAVSFQTEMDSKSVLKILMSIEAGAGRDRQIDLPNGPRNLDLDLILFGSEVRLDGELILPHPRFRQRRFVLEPAVEVAADFVDPISGQSILELFLNCTDPSWVRRREPEVVPA